MSSYTYPKKKKKIIRNYSKILSSASYFPDNIVSNSDIMEKSGLNLNEKIIKRSIGVENRRVADKNLSDSDLLAEAGKICLERAGVHIDQVSRVIATTYLGDRVFPMTASMVKEKLGTNKAAQAFDIDSGTNSFLHALDLAEKYINSGDEYILIVSGGIINNFISKNNPRTAFLFGDGASAILVGKAEKEHFIDSYFYSNYEHFEYAKGFKMKDMFLSLKKGNKEALFDTYNLDNWKNIEPFILEATDKIVKSVVFENDITLEDIDLFLITESNKPLRDSIIKHLNIDENKAISILEEYGNTLSAMLPLLYETIREKNILKKGMKLLFISHGEGLSGGGLLYEINEE